MFYLFIGSLFGMVCSGIAVGKQRSALGWFLIGFFFNVIGLIVVLVIDPPIETMLKSQRQPQTPSRVDELERLAVLRTQGALNESEFQFEKARVMARHDN